MASTFGEQLVQFAQALDAIDDRNFNRFREIVNRYTQKTLGISSSRLMISAQVSGSDAKTIALAPHGLAQDGEIEVTPIRTGNKYSGQLALCFDTGKSLWVVNASGESELAKARGYRELWSGLQRLPPYRAVTNQPVRTSILIPLKYANGRVFGVITFETTDRLDTTFGAKKELENLALALSIIYRLLRDSQSRSKRTNEGLEALYEQLSHPQIKLTKPSIFVASSTRGKADVIKILREVIREKEFRNVFNEVYWKDMNRPGSINQQLLAELGSCRFGVCYLSEEVEDGSHPFQDNINVVFEAGMLHGRSDISSPIPASWIPLREENSPPTPFDFASQRTVIVPRNRDGRLNIDKFKSQFRTGLRGLIDSDRPA